MEKCWLFENCNHKDCEKDFCLRKYKLDFLYNSSLLSGSQRQRMSLRVDDDGTDLEEFKKLALIEKDIDTFVSEGKNLYLHSAGCGCGKTSWSIRMIQSYFNTIWPGTDLECKALFISVPRFLLALKDNISEKNNYITFIKDNIFKADLVVWDDIATKVGTEYEINQLLSFIDGRIALGKSNIYTSNLNKAEMEIALGKRIASRVCQMSIDIELHGQDKRSMLNDFGGSNND